MTDKLCRIILVYIVVACKASLNFMTIICDWIYHRFLIHNRCSNIIYALNCVILVIEGKRRIMATIQVLVWKLLLVALDTLSG